MIHDVPSGYFAVIDVETNWDNQVMSIGVVVADKETFAAVDKRYYILHPEYETGGMYDGALRDINPDLITDCSRSEAIADLSNVFTKYNVKSLFAYNACFDRSHMNELANYAWYDIMRVAPYRQYNSKIPADADCGPSGRLKRGYGVEGIMRMLMGWDGYRESHNALCDAVDELQIMQLLNQPLDVYPKCAPRQNKPLYKSAEQSGSDLMRLSRLKYIVDELCGGAVRVNNYYEKRGVVKADNGSKHITYSLILDLQCSRCGFKWKLDADEFFDKRKCPNCEGNAD